MPVMIKELQALKDELESVAEERIRAEERLKAALSELQRLGFESIDQAEGGVKEIQERINKLWKKAEADYEEFMENYGELFE